MLYFFDDNSLRHYCDQHDISLPDKRLDHTLESLEGYVGAFEEYLDDHLTEFKTKIRDNPYLTLTEREDYNTLSNAKPMVEYLAKVKAFAGETDQHDSLVDRLKYLATYGNDDTRCRIRDDGAPMSFTFVMEKYNHEDAQWQYWFNGGLIYHGSHDRGGDGGAPTYSVNLTPKQGWEVHT